MAGGEKREEERERPEPGVATRAVHGPGAGGGPGGHSEPGTPLATPVDRSTTWVLGDEAYRLRRAGRASEARIYARESSPTVESLEARLADLEGAERAVCFGSGLAALHTLLLATLERGDNLLLARGIYGGTTGAVLALTEKLGVEARPVDVFEGDAWRARADGRTRLLLCESVSNPLGRVADLPRLAAGLRAAAGEEALLVVDATLATPLLQRPLALGAGLVWHSATKSLAGHSDALAGVVLGDEARIAPLRTWRTRAGACLDPAAAFLVERGLKTLALRVRAAGANALALARALERHPRVARVHHASLASHPDHALAERLLAGPSSLFSFEHRGGDDAALALIRRLAVFREASSLGSVESLATRPIDLSHDGLSAEERAAAGIAPGLVRLSVGVEDQADLVADLLAALAD